FITEVNLNTEVTALGFIKSSSLNTQLANYVPINGVTTINNTKTFTSSPVVPNATLNSHAVNLGQLNIALDGYALKNGVNEFTNNNSFENPVKVADPIELQHAVNLGFLENYSQQAEEDILF